MKRTTKKRLLIAGIVILILAVIGTATFYFTVDRMFSRVTQSITENELLQGGNDAETDPLADDGITQGLGQLILQLDPTSIKKLESKIPVEDKLAALSILAKSLPQEEYSRLLSFLSGGISKDEFSQALAVLRQHLTPEDKAQIMQYYTKHLHLLEE